MDKRVLARGQRLPDASGRAVAAPGRRPEDAPRRDASGLRDLLGAGLEPEDEHGDPNDHANHDCDSMGCHRIDAPAAASDAQQAPGDIFGALVGGVVSGVNALVGAVTEALGGGGGGGGGGGSTPATPTGASPGKGSSVANSFAATRSNFAAPAFGQVSWNAKEPAATYRAYVKDGKWRYRLESLTLDVPVGVSAGGRTDVPSGTAGVVTKDTWSTVESDLIPRAAKPRRSPRTTYWSQALTWKHEIFHFAEFNRFLRASFKTFEDTIEGTGYTEAIATDDTEQKALDRKAGDLKSRLLAAWNQAKRNMSPGMEDRAYDDGVSSYQALAADVRKHAVAEGWTT